MKSLDWGKQLSLPSRRPTVSGIQQVLQDADVYRRQVASGLSHVSPRRAAHGLVLSLGVGVAMVAWAQPRQSQQLWNVVAIVADHVSDVLDDISFESPHAAIEPRTHVVEPGETVRALANSYDVSVETIAWSNRLIDPDRIMPGQRLIIPPSDTVVHTAKEGDTIRSIASRYEADPVLVAQANQVSENDGLDSPIDGSIVLVPNPKLPDISEIGAPEGKMATAARPSMDYEVQDGDTILSLANQFGVTVPTLLRANGISDPDMVSVGTKLRVLPVSGIEHEVRDGESLADIASWYEVDLGPIVDFNGLINPDRLKVGQTLIVPGAAKGPKPILQFVPAPVVRQAPAAPAVQTAPSQAPAGRSATASQSAPPRTTEVARAPQQSAPVARAPQSNTVSAASVAPVKALPVANGGVSATAMQFLGRPYIWGGTGPAGFDCSGFVWYVHKVNGKDVSRGLWGQMNGGPRVSRDQLQPGDSVFFANTYMPGLSHAGIYIGGGRFIHASDERTGVTISNLSDGYWGPRYIGASRLT